MLFIRCLATVAAGLKRPAATVAGKIPTTPPTTPHRMPRVMLKSPAVNPAAVTAPAAAWLKRPAAAGA